MLEPYDDGEGNMTIGYGHKILSGEHFTTITKDQAERMLARDVRRFEQAVAVYVKVPLRQYEFDALVSWMYRLGVGNFSTSTTLERLNKGDRKGAADAMTWWTKTDNPKLKQGLVNRVTSERAQFLGQLKDA